MEHMEQIPIRILQEVGPTDFLPESVVARINSEEEAVAWCWARRRVKLSVTEAARYLGMPKSHLSNILAGKKYLPFGKRIELQRLCGNWLIRQWEDRQCGFITQRESHEQREIRVLKARLQDAEMRQAA
jgi:plasmid maintenance system antidote protein VapI